MNLPFPPCAICVEKARQHLPFLLYYATVTPSRGGFAFRGEGRQRLCAGIHITAKSELVPWSMARLSSLEALGL